MGKKYKVEYLPLAERDLLEIVDYISKELYSPQAAHRLLDRLHEAVERLEEFPFSCGFVQDSVLGGKGYRVQPVDHYLVFYVVIGDLIEIRRILYHRRQYLDLL